MLLYDVLLSCYYDCVFVMLLCVFVMLLYDCFCHAIMIVFLSCYYYDVFLSCYYMMCFCHAIMIVFLSCYYI